MTFSHLELFKSSHLSGAEKRITRLFHDLALHLQEDHITPSSEERTQLILSLAEVKDKFLALVSDNGGTIAALTTNELSGIDPDQPDLDFDPNPATAPVVEASNGKETTTDQN